MTTKRYILMDIDGVLADCSHRLKYADKGDYEKFYSESEISNDEPIPGGWEMLRILMTRDKYLDEEVVLILMTGRPMHTKKVTDMWMHYQNTQGFYFPTVEQYYMRTDGDHRPSDKVKREMVQKFMVDYSPSERDTIIFIDDDPTNCEAIEQGFPGVIALTYGTNRFNKIRKEKNVVGGRTK